MGREHSATVSIDGEHITPASVDTGEANNVHYISTSDDPQTVHNEAAAGDTLVFLPGTHTGTLSSTTDGHVLQVNNDDISVVLTGGATVTLADGELASGDSGRLISIATGTSGIEIKGPGTLDGNQANNSVDTPEDFGLIKFGDNVSDVRIDGLSLQNSPGQAIRPKASSGSEITNLQLTGFEVSNCAEGVVWTHAHDVLVSEFDIETITEQDALEPVKSADWVIQHGVVDTTEQSAIDLFTDARDGKIAHVTVKNPGQGNEHGVRAGSSQGAAPSNVEIVDVTVIGAGSANNTGARGFLIDSGCVNVDLVGCESRGADERGFMIQPNTTDCNVIDCDAYENGSEGLEYGGDDGRIEGVTTKNNNQDELVNRGGARISGDQLLVADLQSLDDQATTTQDNGVTLESGLTNSLVHGLISLGNNTNLSNNSDVSTDVLDTKTI
jgi:hypothetical protein